MMKLKMTRALRVRKGKLESAASPQMTRVEQIFRRGALAVRKGERLMIQNHKGGWLIWIDDLPCDRATGNKKARLVRPGQ